MRGLTQKQAPRERLTPPPNLFLLNEKNRRFVEDEPYPAPFPWIVGVLLITLIMALFIWFCDYESSYSLTPFQWASYSFVWCVVILFYSVWWFDEHKRATKGRIIFGRVYDSEILNYPRGGHGRSTSRLVTVTYKYESPVDQGRWGTGTEWRETQAELIMPKRGTPVAILYVGDKGIDVSCNKML